MLGLLIETKVKCTTLIGNLESNLTNSNPDRAVGFRGVSNQCPVQNQRMRRFLPDVRLRSLAVAVEEVDLAGTVQPRRSGFDTIAALSATFIEGLP